MNNKNKIPAVILSLVAYLLLFFVFYRTIGPIVSGVFIFIPAVVFSWNYGTKEGAVFALFMSFLHILIEYLFIPSYAIEYITHFIGAAGIVFIASIIGYSRDNNKKLLKLKEESLALKLGIDRSEDIIFITDTDGLIQYINPSFTTTYGYTKEELEGKTPRILKSGTQGPEFYDSFWKLLKDKKSVSYEMVNKRKDGSLITVYSSVNPILKKNGKLVGYLAIQRNVTKENELKKNLKKRTVELERSKKELEMQSKALMNILDDQKLLQEDYRKDKAQMDLIISSMGEGLLVVDPDYSITMINNAAKKMLGVDGDVVGKKWYNVAKAYDGDDEIPLEERVSIKVLKNAVTIETVLNDNHFYMGENNVRFPVISVTAPIYEGDEVTGAVKVFRDATEERKAKMIIESQVKERTQELHIEQQRRNAILQNTSEGIVLTSDKGLITYVNPAFSKITGLTTDDAQNKEFADIVAAFDVNEKPISAEKISDAAAVTATSQETKMYLERNDNEEKVGVVVNASPVYSNDKFIGVVRVIHDFTDELALQRQKDDFFSIASHELRTPLSVITGNLDTVLEGYGESNLSDIDRQLLNDSQESSDRLIKLVNDFLNVSRLDQGRLKIDLQKLDACKVTESVVKELKSLAEKKGIYLNYKCGEKHEDINADEKLLREMVTNLIGNALKFTNKGGIEISHRVEDNRYYVAVKDTGIGIAEDKQNSLFQRFQQAMQRTTTRQAGGTGLGLYISKHFAQQMGGDLYLKESSLGNGSIFEFWLPLDNSEKTNP